MALRRPEGYLPWRAPIEVDGDGTGDMDYIIERPAVDGLPEVIRILDDEDNNRPDVSSEEEDVFDSDEEDGEVWTDEEDWSEEDSPDSGYSTVTDDEDDPDDDDRSPSPLPLPPANFWQEWRRQCRPFSAAAPLAPRIPDAAPVCAPAAAPSTSGLSTSTKRIREESDTDQVGMKRPRRDGEDNPEEPTPSTSGFSFSTNRTREEDHRDSAPSTSGLLRHFTPLGFPGIQLLYVPNDDSDSD
ncbi:uncharacterized protein AKAME5_001696500 [Lates japonicus]|uniref:Uncharacterized protein n=1 Tax=Lates japonicus TaxID=270547 RepID=A0AAD3RF08_LATJO|nr:uncharacterized protein AKAME5_001696500 [Lates japonicus]